VLQKIIPVGQSVDTYLACPDSFVAKEHPNCPWCPEPHRLWRHGEYRRTAILPGARTVQVPVFRFLCGHARTTVSLLPDFCLPRRQHGPEVLGRFLEALLVTGLTLMGAMRRARPDAPAGHSLPQSLLAGFRRRLPVVQLWLASQRARALCRRERLRTRQVLRRRCCRSPRFPGRIWSRSVRVRGVAIVD
jgi:hypothetical protein